MKTRYQIVYWRDIPAQVKIRGGEAGGKRRAAPLSGRFQESIDRAAMAAGLTGTDEYLEAWRVSEWLEREGDPEALAASLVAELESNYPPDRLQRLERLGGHEETK